MDTGKVYLVGAGPGAPDLLTLKGRELLEQTDVLVYDYLVGEKLLEWTNDGCEIVFVGKRPGVHSVSQEEIHAILVDRAKKGKMVVRLKGGDPFVFGRGGEEVVRLVEAGIEFEIVPGVTAALAAAAYVGIPLTHRDLSSGICFLTGQENIEKQKPHLHFGDFGTSDLTLCIYMGMGQIERIVSELVGGGASPDMPAAVVQYASTPRQRCVRAPLGRLVEAVRTGGLDRPAIIFVGRVLELSEHLGWYQRGTLFGRRVVVTRSRAQAGELESRLTLMGADVLALPLIAVTPDSDAETVDEVFGEIGQYEWIVFTSANGVRAFFDLFFENFEDIRSLGFMRISAVGEATARVLHRHHLKIDLIPTEASGGSLAKEMIERGCVENIKILVVTGSRNRDELVIALETAGAIVDQMPVYATQRTDLSGHPSARRFRNEGADVLTFASPSTVESFVAQAASLQPEDGARRPLTCSIGPVTSEAMRSAGITVNAEASVPSVDGLIQAIIELTSPASP